MKSGHKTILLWVVFVLILVLIYQIMVTPSSNAEKIKYSEFLEAVRSGQVETVEVKGMELRGTFNEEGKREFSKDEFESYGTVDADTRDLLDERAVVYDFQPEDSGGWWQGIIIYWLPMLFLFLLFFFFMRQLQSGGGKAMSFGKSKARIVSEHDNKVTFEDIAGIEEAKSELYEIVEFLKDPKKFTRLGGRIPKGVLLMGGPGTGKTLLARGVAGEAGVPFFSISGSDFVEMFVGVGASRVRDLFEQGKKTAPCIIFIDEIDAVGRYRGAGLGGGHDEREQTLNQLLVEMDGFESNEGVILVAATNRPDVLDPALLRPGRFDRRVVVPNPDVRGRVGILKVHTRKTPLAQDVDLESIARGTPGFSGADLENLVNEAALIAAQRGADRLENEDFEEAKDKVLMGRERRSMFISEKDKRLTAFHEAGHALVAKLLPSGEVDQVHKVTIIPRGRALGLVQQLPDEDRLNVTKQWALNRITIALAGRAAEEIIFNEVTTGAGNDLEQATGIARKMVREWGMSPAMGPIAVGRHDDQPFIGRDMAQPKDYSEQTAQLIDGEIRRIVVEQYDLCKTLLEDNLDLLKLTAEALLEYEVLDGEQLDVLIEQGPESLRTHLEKRRAEAKARLPKAAFSSKLKGRRGSKSDAPPIELVPSKVPES
ncbi:MAG: ATP-dependent zinc metalloprotease FtsH [Myxococcota bacterium]|nr:ATP-dependent zinc metalloprotease FtsH [Myxococcota bacterium]